MLFRCLPAKLPHPELNDTGYRNMLLSQRYCCSNPSIFRYGKFATARLMHVSLLLFSTPFFSPRNSMAKTLGLDIPPLIDLIQCKNAKCVRNY